MSALAFEAEMSAISAPARHLVPRRRPRLLLECGVVLFLMFVYDRIAALVGVHVNSAMTRGASIVRLEHTLRIGIEDNANRLLVGHQWLSSGFSLYYDFAHGTVTIGVLIALYVLAPTAYRDARTALVAINVVAFIVFVLYPVAPPRFVPSAHVVDIVAHSGTLGAWEQPSTVAGRHANEYASVPSLHVAWALWVLLAVCAATKRRLVRGLALSHVVATVVVVITTGNHYVVDVFAGVLLSSAAVWWVHRFTVQAPVRSAKL